MDRRPRIRRTRDSCFKLLLQGPVCVSTHSLVTKVIVTDAVLKIFLERKNLFARITCHFFNSLDQKCFLGSKNIFKTRYGTNSFFVFFLVILRSCLSDTVEHT